MRYVGNDSEQHRISRRTAIAGSLALAASARMARGVAQMPVADDASVGDDGARRLADMLSLLPESLLPDGGMLFDWLDYERHFSAAGLAYPLEEMPPVEYLTAIVTSDPLLQWAKSEDVVEFLGFSSFDVHQVLCVGIPPGQVLIYRGGVAFGDLPETWEAGGYEAVSGELGDFWTRGQGGELDFQDPLQQKVMARMNNIALLDETTLACAPTAALLGTIVRHVTEGGASVAESPGIAPVLDRLPEGTASVAGFGGDVFDMASLLAGQVLGGPAAFQMVEDEVAESDAAVGPMPRIRSVIGGVPAGAKSGEDGDQSAFLAILPLSKEHARNVADVVFWRHEHMTSLVTGEPYADLLTITNTADTAVDGPVAIFELSSANAGPGVWYRFIMQQDILMFAW